MIIPKMYNTKIRCTNSVNGRSDIGADMNIEVKLQDYNDNPVIGEPISLMIDAPYDVINNTTPARQTVTGVTDKDGIFTHTVTDAIHGIWSFTCNENHFNILRDGWLIFYNGTNVRVFHNYRFVMVYIAGNLSSVGTTWKTLYTISNSNLRQFYPVSQIVRYGSNYRIAVTDNGTVLIKHVSTTGNPGLSQGITYQKKV